MKKNSCAFAIKQNKRCRHLPGGRSLHGGGRRLLIGDPVIAAVCRAALLVLILATVRVGLHLTQLLELFLNLDITSYTRIIANRTRNDVEAV